MTKSSKMQPPRRNRRQREKLDIPSNWTFRSRNVAKFFDHHVRESLPWYDLATGIVAHLVRSYLPTGGDVLDVGCSTGNIGRALSDMLDARDANLLGIDASEEMKAVYDAPGEFAVVDATVFDFNSLKPDVIVCFLSLMFVAPKDRGPLIYRMQKSIKPGGALIVFDKMTPRPGYVGTVAYRLTLAAKHEAGASSDEVIRKELSISGLQRPMAEEELSGFCEVFRFGDFAGLVWEAPLSR